jgi:hypothetical protein
MSNYYYTDGTEKFGPFTLEELKSKGITKETKVWFHPMPDWKAAGEVPEMNPLFGDYDPTIPPPTTSANQTQSQNMTNQMPPKTWLVESILVTILCCLPFGIVGIVYASKVESLFYAGSIEASKKASEDAGRWTKIGFWIGLSVVLLYFLLVFGFGFAGVLSTL